MIIYRAKIKKCPFCGGKAELGKASEKLETRTAYLNSWVSCTKCGCSKVSETHQAGILMSRKWQDNNAIDKWNARAYQTETPETYYYVLTKKSISLVPTMKSLEQAREMARRCAKDLKKEHVVWEVREHEVPR